MADISQWPKEDDPAGHISNLQARLEQQVENSADHFIFRISDDEYAALCEPSAGHMARFRELVDIYCGKTLKLYRVCEGCGFASFMRRDMVEHFNTGICALRFFNALGTCDDDDPNREVEEEAEAQEFAVNDANVTEVTLEMDAVVSNEGLKVEGPSDVEEDAPIVDQITEVTSATDEISSNDVLKMEVTYEANEVASNDDQITPEMHEGTSNEVLKVEASSEGEEVEDHATAVTPEVASNHAGKTEVTDTVVISTNRKRKSVMKNRLTIGENEDRYQCPLCKSEMAVRNRYHHIRRYCPVKFGNKKPCTHCQMLFNNWRDVKRHIRDVHNPNYQVPPPPKTGPPKIVRPMHCSDGCSISNDDQLTKVTPEINEITSNELLKVKVTSEAEEEEDHATDVTLRVNEVTSNHAEITEVTDLVIKPTYRKRKSVMKNRPIIGENEDRYQCPLCKSEMAVRNRYHHERRYCPVKFGNKKPCTHCQMLFNNWRDVKRHIRDVHNPNYQVPPPPKTVRETSNVPANAPTKAALKAPSKVQVELKVEPVAPPPKAVCPAEVTPVTFELASNEVLKMEVTYEANEVASNDDQITAEEIEDHTIDVTPEANEVTSNQAEITEVTDTVIKSTNRKRKSVNHKRPTIGENEDRYQCPLCKKEMAIENRYHHLRRYCTAKFGHKKPCYHCQMLFNNWRDVKRHIRDVHNPNYQVPPPPNTVPSKLVRPRKSLKPKKTEDRYQCPLCEREMDKGRKQYHIRQSCPVKFGNKKPCYHCPMLFDSIKEVRQHIKTEHNIPGYSGELKCKECGKQFKGLAGLKMHCRNGCSILKIRETSSIPTKAPPKVRCKDCLALFLVPDLARHQQNDCKKTPLDVPGRPARSKKFKPTKVTLKCNRCQICCVSRLELARHKAMFCRQSTGQQHETVPPMEKLFLCNECLVKFATKEELERHRREDCKDAVPLESVIKVEETVLDGDVGWDDDEDKM